MIADQVRRLEEAMVVQRRWHVVDFRSAIAGHPLLSVLATRLVWDLDGTLATLDPLGDLVDPKGGLVEDPTWLRIAHPATCDLRTWREWLVARAIEQPFEQILRDVFDEDPSRSWNGTASAASSTALPGRAGNGIPPDAPRRGP